MNHSDNESKSHADDQNEQEFSWDVIEGPSIPHAHRQRQDSRAYPNQFLGPNFAIATTQPMSIRDRLNSIRQRRISKLMEAEASESGGFVDRTSSKPLIDVEALKSDIDQGRDISNTLIIRMIKEIRSKKDKKAGEFESNGGDHPGVVSFATHPSLVRETLYLTWKDIKYEVKIKKEIKEILHGISGEAHPGEMLALMGSSGAGKTTLLNILAGRIANGTISGIVLANGKKRDVHSWKYMIGYVEQEDVMYRTLTVKETFYYAALLRLSPYLTHKQKKERAIQVMTELGLSKVAKTKIGDEFHRGLSGGERKRVAIGIELIVNPGLLFLDEPTSGLDAYTAYNIMESISVLALRELKTVIATMHQPREDILFLFDKLLLITGGYCVYSGPIIDLMNWFDKLGYKSPTFVNPADFVIDLISIDTRDEELGEKSLSRIRHLVEAWRDHLRESDPLRITVENGNETTCDQTEQLGDDKSANAFNESTSQSEQKKSSKNINPRNTWMKEFLILLGRSFLHQLRSKHIINMIIVQTLFIILLIGFTFFQLPLNQDGAQARVGVMLFFVVNIAFSTIQSVSLVFPLERVVIIRERYAGSYRVSSYYIAKALSLLPIRIVAVMVYVFATYYIIGLNPPADRLFILLGIMLDTMFCAYAYGLLIGSLSKTPEHSQIISIMILLTQFVYAGNLISATIVPPELSWLQYLSFMRYSYSAALQNELDGLVFLCQDNQPPVNGSCSPGFATGEQVLEQYDLNQFSISTCCLIIMGMGFGINVLAYIVLRFTSKPPMKL